MTEIKTTGTPPINSTAFKCEDKGSETFQTVHSHTVDPRLATANNKDLFYCDGMTSYKANWKGCPLKLLQLAFI